MASAKIKIGGEKKRKKSCLPIVKESFFLFCFFFFCIAAICKDTMYKTVYVDKKCREKTRSFHQAQISIGAHVRSIREDFLNTKLLSIYQPVTVHLLVSVSLIDNSKLKIDILF